MTPYHARHRFITWLKERGIDDTTIGKLCGTGARMIAATYYHLDTQKVADLLTVKSSNTIRTALTFLRRSPRGTESGQLLAAPDNAERLGPVGHRICLGQSRITSTANLESDPKAPRLRSMRNTVRRWGRTTLSPVPWADG